MGLPSKEENVLELFFNEGSKHWHFEEIVKKSGLSRDKVNKWLNRFISESLIKKVKEKKRMPYYIGDFSNPAYKNKKRLYTLQNFYITGFLNHLMSLPKAETVIIFGSFARSDWHSNSDIDLFVYGSADGFKLGKYESILGREIQLFECCGKNDLKKFSDGLIKNIIRGNFVKGNIDFVEVKNLV
ncbi:nucleotidyltransferase domain-containing protein [Candidatus Woesearchaeota archaeon]|nr:nucleotidyltransferase domain-containing protein [Candidatus Woesearchaeota archaeon]